jgi:hypothetical protein
MALPQDQMNSQPRFDTAYEYKNKEEDIETFMKQNKLDKDPLLDLDEAKVQADLSMRKANKMKELDQYLHDQNILIHHKKLLCMRSCYSDLDKPTKQIMPCVQSCQRSETRFNTFVTKLFGRLA